MNWVGKFHPYPVNVYTLNIPKQPPQKAELIFSRGFQSHLGIRKMGATIDDLRITPWERHPGAWEGEGSKGERDGQISLQIIGSKKGKFSQVSRVNTENFWL